MLEILVACLWAFLVSKVLGIEPPQPGYSVEVLQWEVPVSPDGRTAILNGTVQQVYKQLVEIDPNYRPEFGIVDNKYLAPRPAQNRESQALREMERHSWSDCGHFDPATTEAVWQGIYHLSHVPGRPVSIPGPGVCGRVSCSYDSAIWWCNDMYTEKTLSSFDDIGASVQLLTGKCAYWSEAGMEPHVSGQHFHIDNWNTIVSGAAC